MDLALTPAELRRYGRHLVLPELGREGQERLKAGRVLLVGAGGLGSPAALYLAAAGVGTLGLVDDQMLIVGSQNLHYSAFGTGGGLTEFNLAVEDPQAVADFQALFEHVWGLSVPAE